MTTEQTTESVKDFIAKIEWEGGVVGALEYGLSTDAYDLPSEMKKDWDELRVLHQPLAAKEQEFLDKYDPEGGE